MAFPKIFLLALALAVPLAPPVGNAQGVPAPDWAATVTPFTPGDFPPLRPVEVTYSFGWSGVTAASAVIRLEKPAAGPFHFDATGGTIGFARKLWPFDIKQQALADSVSLRPLRVEEQETRRAKEFKTVLTYTPTGVVSAREERRDGKVQAKTRTFDFPNVLSLHSALLFLRTVPLPDGSRARVVVYPATSAYLCTITVLGRERFQGATGAYPAIKLDVQLSKIGKDMQLQPHKKFRSATVWLSDDSDRLPLRIEAQIFVGKVFADLQSVRFLTAKP